MNSQYRSVKSISASAACRRSRNKQKIHTVEDIELAVVEDVVTEEVTVACQILVKKLPGKGADQQAI